MKRKLKIKTSQMLSAAGLLFCMAPCYADDGPAPGPSFEARQKLYERIQQARSQGMGIGSYMQAFRGVEDQVKAGDSPDKISTRVDSLHKAVSDQIERAKILKNQRPIPPQGSQLTGGEPINHSGPAGAGKAAPAAGGSGSSGGVSNQLKDKIDALPDSVKEKILEKIQEKTGGAGLPAGIGGAPGGGAPPGPPPGQQ